MLQKERTHFLQYFCDHSNVQRESEEERGITKIINSNIYISYQELQKVTGIKCSSSLNNRVDFMKASDF